MNSGIKKKFEDPGSFLGYFMDLFAKSLAMVHRGKRYRWPNIVKHRNFV